MIPEIDRETHNLRSRLRTRAVKRAEGDETRRFKSQPVVDRQGNCSEESTPTIGRSVETNRRQVLVLDRFARVHCESDETKDQQVTALGESVATKCESVDDKGRQVETKCESASCLDESVACKSESAAFNDPSVDDSCPSVETRSESATRLGESAACKSTSVNVKYEEVKNKNQSKKCILKPPTSIFRRHDLLVSHAAALDRHGGHHGAAVGRSGDTVTAQSLRVVVGPTYGTVYRGVAHVNDDH